MDSIVRVASYDGQTVWLENRVPLYEVGNFLGGGAAGTVYEAENVKTKEHFALKILNPLGYKMLSPSLLRRCTVLTKGKPVSEAAERAKEPITKENVWWLLNGSTKQHLVAYYSERQRSLHELSLVQCMNIWGVELSEGASCQDSPSPSRGSPSRNNIPAMPPKYEDFVRRRARIFREICNMRKISPHVNVIRLESVLELAQDSKCTIFLVMELANGGELFDRIKIDCGTVEETAGKFFSQLLQGVRHCHEEGVCHRDLKPENLLLQDMPDGPILKIADFGFSARLAMADGEVNPNNSSPASSIPLYSTNNPNSPIASNGTSPMRVLMSVVGSPFYVAPEVLQAQGYDGSKADSWSLGVILYAMLAGNLPFSQELSTCKRFRQFCIWAREQSAECAKFWQNPSLVCPPWLFSVKFSTQLRGLIVAMLLPDPKDRISVREAQQHNWCKAFATPTYSTLTHNAGSRQESDSALDEVDTIEPASSHDDNCHEHPVVESDVPDHCDPVSIEVLSLADRLAGEEHNDQSGINPSTGISPNIKASLNINPSSQLLEENNKLKSSTSAKPKQDNKFSMRLMDVEMGSVYAENDDSSGQHEVDDEDEQFQMDDEDDIFYNESALKRSKKSPGTTIRHYDQSWFRENEARDDGKVYRSLFHDDSGNGLDKIASRLDTPPPLLGANTETNNMRKGENDFNPFDSDQANLSSSDAPYRIPRSPYEGNFVPCGVGGGSSTYGSNNSSISMASSPRRSLTTPPPVPTNAIPFISGTPDLLCDDHPLFDFDSTSERQRTLRSNDHHRGSITDASIEAYPPCLSGIVDSCYGSGGNGSPSNGKKPPSFHDAVKRSTRFITSVPAGEVLETVESILEQCRIHKTASPIGVIGRVEVSWDSYRLDVWGADTASNSPPICSLQLYQIPNAQSTPNSPMRSAGAATNYNNTASAPAYMVEFVRGQLEIFAFKRFYEWVRQRISELVKRDYAFNLFDQSGSPILVSNIASSPLRGIMSHAVYRS